jgi:hypothetical protein
VPVARDITINEPFETRTAHTSVKVTSEPIKHTFDERALGEGPAKVIARVIAEQIRKIGATATKATLDRRGRRHHGMPPTHQSGAARLFNATGKLAELAIRYANEAWEIAAPAGRLGSEWSPANLERMMTKLRELVPALRDPLSHPDVRAAIEKTIGLIIRR